MSTIRSANPHRHGYPPIIGPRNLGTAVRIVCFLAIAVGFLLSIPVIFDNSVGFRILLVGLFYLSVVLGARDHNIFSPFNLFSLVPLSAALYDYRFVPHYLSPLTNETYTLIVYNVSVFLLGLSMVRFTSAGRFGNEPVSTASLKKWTWILLAIGSIPTAYVLIAAPSLVFSGRVLEAAVYAQSVPYSWVLGLFKYFGVAMALKTEHKGTIVGAMTACIVSLALSFNKTQLLFFYDDSVRRRV